MLRQFTSNNDIEISIKKVSLKQIYAPKNELLNDIFKFFVRLNFNSNLVFWSNFANTEMMLIDFPIYVTTKNNIEFELVGGFRTYQILCSIGTKNIDVIDVSLANNQQIMTICLQTAVAPMLVWSSTDIHSKSLIKSFLKDIEKIFPELRQVIPDERTYSKSISRHIGRKRKVKLSNLSMKIAEKLEKEGVKNEGK